MAFFRIIIIKCFFFLCMHQEAEREVALTLEEKEKALQDLQNALNSHDKEVAARLIINFTNFY